MDVDEAHQDPRAASSSCRLKSAAARGSKRESKELNVNNISVDLKGYDERCPTAEAYRLHDDGDYDDDYFIGTRCVKRFPCPRSHGWRSRRLKSAASGRQPVRQNPGSKPSKHLDVLLDKLQADPTRYKSHVPWAASRDEF